MLSSVPVPTVDHATPFHERITFVAPAASRSPLGFTSSVFTAKFAPVPRPLQLVPFHLAMFVRAGLPLVAKNPPATRLPSLSTAKALTAPWKPLGAMVDHVVPSHSASREETPPRSKLPPTTMWPLGSTATALTPMVVSPTPAPSACQLVPSHCATFVASTPPAEAKVPPAITSPFGRTAVARTPPSIPDPRLVQVAPFHRAMLLAAIPPTESKLPPRRRSPLGKTRNVETRFGCMGLVIAPTPMLFMATHAG